MNASAFKEEMASTHAYFSARRGTFVFRVCRSDRALIASTRWKEEIPKRLQWNTTSQKSHNYGSNKNDSFKESNPEPRGKPSPR
mmetsp:Transcript_4201/g.9952  ORF Transcript_4201/g.9952 Transcript_4201/m.9952 type:complete len:84 (-) Transcript_4201:727-978(-)